MRRLLNALGSRALTVYLLIVYAAFVALLAAWGAKIPPQVVLSISGLAPFWLWYLLAGVHLLCCLWVFWAALRQRSSLAPPAGEGGTPVSADFRTCIQKARRAGFRVIVDGDGRAAVAFRNRWSPAGTLLFHGAMLLLPAAFLLSRATRFRGDAWLVEGHAFGGTRAEYTSVEPTDAFDRRAPRLNFHVETVEASFWGDRLFFTDLRAVVVESKGEASSSRWITLPQPTWMDGARVSIRGFNYTTSFELAGPDGRLLDSGDLKLRLFPPGTEDSFSLPGLPHRFWVRLYPDSEGPGSQPINRGYHLGAPLFHVAVTRGKALVTHAWLRPGEPLAFEGFWITFPNVLKGGELLVHRDLGYPLLWTAFLLALAGLLARIVFPSARLWLADGGGEVRVILREDEFSPGRARALLEGWRAHGN